MGRGWGACFFSGDLAGDLAGKCTAVAAAVLGPPHPTAPQPLPKRHSQPLYLVSLRPTELLIQSNIACGSFWKYALLSSGLSHRPGPLASSSCHLNCHPSFPSLVSTETEAGEVWLRLGFSVVSLSLCFEDTEGSSVFESSTPHEGNTPGTGFHCWSRRRRQRRLSSRPPVCACDPLSARTQLRWGRVGWACGT